MGAKRPKSLVLKKLFNNQNLNKKVVFIVWIKKYKNHSTFFLLQSIQMSSYMLSLFLMIKK